MLKIVEAGLFQTEDYFDVEVTPKRIVKFYEIELYERSDSFSTVDNIKYSHASPHLLIARPGAERFSTGRSKCYYLKCTDLDEAAAAVLDKLPVYIPVNTYETYAGLFDRCIRYQSADELHSRIYKTGCALQLVSYIADNSPLCANQLPKPHRYSKNILKTKEYMDENFGLRITLETLASMAYLSKNFYRSVFTEMMEVSPQKYLTKIRIANAVKMICEGTRSYQEIAQICGFESQSYMNYVLKRATGKTPSQHRADGAQRRAGTSR